MINQTALLIEFDSFEPQHPEFPIAMRHRRTALKARLVFLPTEPSDRSIRGNDSMAWDERSEGVICESGADCADKQPVNVWSILEGMNTYRNVASLHREHPESPYTS